MLLTKRNNSVPRHFLVQFIIVSITYLYSAQSTYLHRHLSYYRKESGSSDLLYIFIRNVRVSGTIASIAIVHTRKFYKMYTNIVRFIFVFKTAKRSIRCDSPSFQRA